MPEIAAVTVPGRVAPGGGTLRSPGRAPGALDETITLLAGGRLRLRAHKSMPMQQAAEAHQQLESGNAHQRIILTLP